MFDVPIQSSTNLAVIFRQLPREKFSDDFLRALPGAPPERHGFHLLTVFDHGIFLRTVLGEAVVQKQQPAELESGAECTCTLGDHLGKLFDRSDRRHVENPLFVKHD